MEVTTIIHVSIRDSITTTEGQLTNIFTLYDALFNSISEAIPSLFLIAVVSCAIEEAVAHAERGFDSLFEQSQ